MNFDFLKHRPGFRVLANFASEAETFAVSHPAISATSARKALETLVKTFYKKKYGQCRIASLFDLIQDAQFSAYMDETQLSAIHLVRSIGNNATHGERINKSEAIKSLEALYYATREIMRFFGDPADYPRFDSAVYVKSEVKPTSTVEEIEKTKVEVTGEGVPAVDTSAVSGEKTAKAPIDFTEAETRRIYIDAALREAGWKICHTEGAVKPGEACIETRLEGMPNSSEVGFADYVLFDDDNRPLAVIEAKRTCKDENEGSKQAKLYANCIERIWGIRPVIFYTNGYVIKMVDGTGAPARRVFGYYTKEELHSLIVRRDLRKITDTRINPEISDRYFIQNAATAVANCFNNLSRKALVVMATGTGKTRCAISIVDVLQRANWVKNVLFLADRKTLVGQAATAFKTYLPSSSISALSEEKNDERDYSAKIILSTYKTLLNLIDSDDKKFGIGRFDLIIVDECHRSVYNRYKAIFNYFDSLMLGLTATPREQVDASTYELFEMGKGEPTFAYDYATAVSEDYLVNYYPMDKTTNLLKNGLKYEDLSDEQKEEYEHLFADEDGNFPSQLNKEAFLSQVMNNDTIDLVLNTLMTEGLYVNSGERLGKTIIFASKHEHAQRIVDRFKFLYPEKGDTFCQLIDYSVNYAQTIIDDFKVPEKEPIIAVSVDMLDTGVDVPEIVNLVFFKRVFSVIKFWQMIGRGTRTCKGLNVTSPSREFFKLQSDDATVERHEDKQGFYIFDFCDNFEFFSIHPDGRKLGTGVSLSQRIFNLKIEMIYELQKAEHQENADHKAYYEKWRSECHKLVKNFNRNLVNVKYNLKFVDKYSQEDTWNYLSIFDVKEIQKTITPLISAVDIEENAKFFDVWLFKMELEEIIGENDYSKAIQKVTDVCEELLDKTTIPAVKVKEPFIKEALTTEFWSEITIDKLERVRTELRDLMKFLSTGPTPIIDTNFPDVVITKQGTRPLIPQFKNYKRRVEDYLAENVDLPVIQKIRNVEKLNAEDIKQLEHILWEVLGSKQDYEHTFQGEPLGVLVRKIVGIENEAVNKIHAQFLAQYNFSPKQEEFIKMIISYVRQNGDVAMADLINKEPFKRVDFIVLFGDKTKAVYDLVNTYHQAVYSFATA